MCFRAQKNFLFETVLLSIHIICLDRILRKLYYNYALLSKGQTYTLTTLSFERAHYT